jgi:hypothetical protein
MTDMPILESIIRNEVRASVGFNALTSMLLFFVFFGMDEPVRLWGIGQWVTDFLPQSFMTIFMSVLVPGVLARRKLRAVALVPASHSSVLPRHLVLRALLWGLVTAFVVTALIAGLVWLTEAEVIAPTPALLIKTIYGAGIGLIVTTLSLRADLKP